MNFHRKKTPETPQSEHENAPFDYSLFDLRAINDGNIKEEESYKELAWALKSHCKNIAVIGSYGTGKSSFIQSSLGHIKTTKKIRCKYISSLRFTGRTEGTTKDGNAPDEPANSLPDNQTPHESPDTKKTQPASKAPEDGHSASLNIQKEILKQLYFSCDPNELKHSRYFRLGRSLSEVESLFLSIVIVNTILIFCSLFLYFRSNGFSSKTLLESLALFSPSMATLDLMLPLAVIGVAILAILISKLSSFLYAHPIGGLKLRDFGVTINDNIPDFDQFLDELIYIFRVKKYNLVIFEDIDRASGNTTEIFCELRDLNNLLNEALHTTEDDTITFLYAIDSTLFQKVEDCAKFFDYAIYLPPFMSAGNKSDRIIELFEKAGLSIRGNDKCINFIAKNFPDMRSLKLLAESSRLLKAELARDVLSQYADNFTRNDVKIVGICAYKLLFPKDARLLGSNHGELWEFFSGSNIRLAEKNLRNKKLLSSYMRLRRGEVSLVDWTRSLIPSNNNEIEEVFFLDEEDAEINYLSLNNKQIAQRIADGAYIEIDAGDATYSFKIGSPAGAPSDKYDYFKQIVQLLLEKDDEALSELTRDYLLDTECSGIIKDLYSAQMIGADYLLYTTAIKSIEYSASFTIFKNINLSSSIYNPYYRLGTTEVCYLHKMLLPSDYANKALYNICFINYLIIRDINKINEIAELSEINHDDFLNFCMILFGEVVKNLSKKQFAPLAALDDINFLALRRLTRLNSLNFCDECLSTYEDTETRAIALAICFSSDNFNPAVLSNSEKLTGDIFEKALRISHERIDIIEDSMIMLGIQLKDIAFIKSVGINVERFISRGLFELSSKNISIIGEERIADLVAKHAGGDDFALRVASSKRLILNDKIKDALLQNKDRYKSTDLLSILDKAK